MKCLRRTKEFSAQVIGKKINDVGLSGSGVLGEADIPNQKTNGGGEGVGGGLAEIGYLLAISRQYREGFWDDLQEY